jgi:hypothetical protein
MEMTPVKYQKHTSDYRLVYLLFIVRLFLADFSDCFYPFLCCLSQFPCRRSPGLSHDTKRLCLETYRKVGSLKQFARYTLNVG